MAQDPSTIRLPYTDATGNVIPNTFWEVTCAWPAYPLADGKTWAKACVGIWAELITKDGDAETIAYPYNFFWWDEIQENHVSLTSGAAPAKKVFKIKYDNGYDAAKTTVVDLLSKGTRALLEISISNASNLELEAQSPALSLRGDFVRQIWKLNQSGTGTNSVEFPGPGVSDLQDLSNLQTGDKQMVLGLSNRIHIDPPNK